MTRAFDLLSQLARGTIALDAQSAGYDKSIFFRRCLDQTLVPKRARSEFRKGAAVKAGEVVRLTWLGAHDS
jgi:hypothetical protein